MGKISKLLAVVLATVSFSCVTIAQEAVKARPGAMLMVYDDVPNPDLDPIAVIVDKATGFEKGNLRQNSDTEKLVGQGVYMLWKGYIHIPAPGKYTFVLSYDRPSRGEGFETVLYVNSKAFLSLSMFGGDKQRWNHSGSLTLDKGDYEISILHKALNGGSYSSFSLKMWNRATPLKKVTITPAAMVHAE